MYEYKAKLIKVVDGDTVDAMIDCGFSVFRKERIRLYGINTPEVRTKDKEEKKRGFESKARLETLLDRFPYFNIHTEYQRGKYGRTLGVLYLPDGLNINETLIQEGFAEIYG